MNRNSCAEREFCYNGNGGELLNGRVQRFGLQSGSWNFKPLQSVEKLRFQAVQKGLRCEAHDKSTSGGVLKGYVKARRLCATKQVSLFQQPV
jgi:hypothetical protein